MGTGGNHNLSHTEISRWVREWKSQQTTLAYISTPRARVTFSNLRHPSPPRMGYTGYYNDKLDQRCVNV